VREERLVEVLEARFDDHDVADAHPLEAAGDRESAVSAADHDDTVVLLMARVSRVGSVLVTVTALHVVVCPARTDAGVSFIVDTF
jgi:hypothetical protein